ncbi:TetR/AcrR family transcriptional regulator [Cryptosporangium aurantiacum]|uniref:TetR/AcrR family transcriptional regulator n=1 Tax=Cryptosporangium aurantiacum TaxID=134849 RepID=UPI0009355414|nr:TetR/AcrR family transcriptional regulator [Cryptosporangium aurantiacum]
MAQPDDATPRRPRRAPTNDERQRDAERSRQRLLAAALDEFAARGYAGARVGAIAARAGLNAQLISYYFGGKAGLYRALQESWLERESALTAEPQSLPDLIAAYARAALDDPRGARLLLSGGLHDDEPETSVDPTGAADVAEMTRRQAEGEIASDLDPALLQVALMGATLAPVALPQVVRRLTGAEPDDPEFTARYVEFLRRLAARLGE